MLPHGNTVGQQASVPPSACLQLKALKEEEKAREALRQQKRKAKVSSRAACLPVGSRSTPATLLSSPALRTHSTGAGF